MLLEFNRKVNISLDGVSKNYVASELKDAVHRYKVFEKQIEEDQVINITEAVLINYFKPEYNRNFVNNFPNQKHIGYKDYLDLDYNCINVELDLRFDDRSRLSLYSKVAKTDSYRIQLFNIICLIGTKQLEEWYPQQKYYSKERLDKIYAWINYCNDVL